MLGEEMDDLHTLGQLLKELRVSAGLTREACSGVLNRDHLAKVEQGKQGLTLGKLLALCELLQISPSIVLFALETRRADATLAEQKQTWDESLDDLIKAGRLSNDVQRGASRGVRGKRADETSGAVRQLQASGLGKMEIVRRLGVARSTVDRYWVKKPAEL